MHNDLCCRKANYCQLVHGIGSYCGLILNEGEHNEVRDETSVTVTSVTITSVTVTSVTVTSVTITSVTVLLIHVRNLKHANRTCTRVCVRNLCTNMKSKSTKMTRTL